MRFMPSTPPAKRLTITERYNNLREDFEVVARDHERISEALSNAVAMLRQEDIGWAAPGFNQQYRGLTLEQLKNWSFQIRASLTGTETNAPNPHMRNGIMLRHSFVWDGGMHYDGLPEKGTRGKKNVRDLIEKINERKVFGSSARRRREESLYSTGIYLLLGENSTKKLEPVPLHNITDTLQDEFWEDEIIAYRITRNEAVRDKSRANQRNPRGTLTGERKENSFWVYVDTYEGERFSKIRYNGKEEPVKKTHTIFDLHANRPDGATFGSPDAISALIWARVIRDLVLDGVKMQDALAMFAFKATSKSKKGQSNLALELADPAKRDAAKAAITGDDIDLDPLATAGKGYDFASIGFIVSIMAASLHISGISLSANTALAGSSYGAAKTLDLPGRMAMSTRRAEHVEFDKRLLRWMNAEDVVPYFNSYDDATDEYRSVQAAYLMWQSGNLSPEGFRAELEAIYGRKLVGGIPKGVIIPNNMNSLAQQQEITAPAQDSNPDGTPKKQAPAANQGRSDGSGGAGHANDMPKNGG